MVTRLFHKQEKTMKKNLWAMLMAVLMIPTSSIVFTACGNDDDEKETETAGNAIENNGNNTGANVDYTATTSVKTATLTMTSTGYGSSNDGNVTIYEDFSYKYQLSLLDGRMMLYPYIRTNGYWTVNGETNYGNSSYLRNINIQGRGKISSITDVNEKVALDGSLKKTDWPVAQPKHGYAACYRTENGTLNLRLYISDYKLDSEGTLQSITVQYQLF